jgi:hypothetical protein
MLKSQRELVLAHRHLSLQGNGFLIVRIYNHRARGKLRRLSAISSLQEDSDHQNVGVDVFRVPENSGLQRGDCRLLIPAPLIDSPA